MRILFVVACVFMVTIVSAQTTVRKKKTDHEMRSNFKKATPSTTKSFPKSSAVTTEKVRVGPKKNTKGSVSAVRYSQTTPIKRMSSLPKKTSIKNQINSALSDVDNLVNLKKEREVVNRVENKSLLGTDDYKVLNSNILILKNNLKNKIKSKGFEKCSVKEQNFYLASLKEDGEFEEYKKNVELIKSSK